MSKDQTPARLPFFLTGTIGHVGHGKTTLSEALIRIATGGSSKHPIEGVLGKREQYCFTPSPSWREKLPKHGQEELPWFGRTNRAEALTYQTERWQAGHFDFPGHFSRVHNVAARIALLDMAIVVVSGVDSVKPQTREHLIAAKAAGVTRFVVFINFCDLVDDMDWLDLVEFDVRELFASVGLSGDQVQIIRGSARAAYQGDARWESPILSLLEAQENLSLSIERARNAEPLFAVERAYSITGKGTVVTGKLLQGKLLKNHMLHVHGLPVYGQTKPLSAPPIEIEVFYQSVKEIQAGDYAGLLLRGVRRYEMKRGQILSREATLQLYTEFICTVTLLSTEEGGRHTPIFHKHQAQFYLGSADICGILHFPKEVFSISPGDKNISKVQVRLWYGAFVTPGMTFLIRDGSDGIRFTSSQGSPAWERTLAERQWGGVIGFGVIESLL